MIKLQRKKITVGNRLPIESFIVSENLPGGDFRKDSILLCICEPSIGHTIKDWVLPTEMQQLA